jgi:hypothetical protein
MAINEWKIWQKLGIVKPVEEVVNINKDLDAISLFLKETIPVGNTLMKQITEMKKLRKKEKELRKAGKDIKFNILQQVRIYDKILENYEFFEQDTDVNGERVKKISHALGKTAKQEMIDKKWIEKIRKSERWTFNW